MGRPKIYKINENYFENINTENKAYLLGFIFADGSVYNNNLNIVIHKKDLEILEFIKKELESEHPIKVSKIDYIRFSISNKKIYHDLTKNNIIQNKTYNTSVLPYKGEFFSHFLRGLFDGDGCISTSSNSSKDYCISISNSFNVLKEIKDYLKENLNINSNLRLRHKNNKNSAMLEFKGSLQIEKFYNFIYYNSNFSLNRKKERFNIPLMNAISYKKTDYRNNGTWEKIIVLYEKNISQKEISKKLNIPYSSIRSCIQRMRKINLELCK